MALPIFITTTDKQGEFKIKKFHLKNFVTNNHYC